MLASYIPTRGWQGGRSRSMEGRMACLDWPLGTNSGSSRAHGMKPARSGWIRGALGAASQAVCGKRQQAQHANGRVLAALRRKPPVCYRLPECSAKSSRRNRKEVDSTCDIRGPSTISHIGVRIAQGLSRENPPGPRRGDSRLLPNCPLLVCLLYRRFPSLRADTDGFWIGWAGPTTYIRLQMMGCGMSCMSDLLLCLTRSLPVFPRGRVQRGRSIGVAGRRSSWLAALPHARALYVLGTEYWLTKETQVCLGCRAVRDRTGRYDDGRSTNLITRRDNAISPLSPASWGGKRRGSEGPAHITARVGNGSQSEQACGQFLAVNRLA